MFPTLADSFCPLIASFASAKVLARIMTKDITLMTYSDIAEKAFGPAARFITTMLFCLELTALRSVRPYSSLESFHSIS